MKNQLDAKNNYKSENYEKCQKSTNQGTVIKYKKNVVDNSCNNCFCKPVHYMKCISSNGILLELSENSALIEMNQNIPFNIEKTNTDPQNIKYDFETNIISLNKPGLYTFDWWLGIEGVEGTKEISIDIEVEDDNGIKQIYSSTHPVIIIGFAYGQNLIKTNSRVKIRLINSSIGNISLSNHTKMQGSLRIYGTYCDGYN